MAARPITFTSVGCHHSPAPAAMCIDTGPSLSTHRNSSILFRSPTRPTWPLLLWFSRPVGRRVPRSVRQTRGPGQPTPAARPMTPPLGTSVPTAPGVRAVARHGKGSRPERAHQHRRRMRALDRNDRKRAIHDRIQPRYRAFHPARATKICDRARRLCESREGGHPHIEATGGLAGLIIDAPSFPPAVCPRFPLLDNPRSLRPIGGARQMTWRARIGVDQNRGNTFSV
jgi:hypothetical protein